MSSTIQAAGAVVWRNNKDKTEIAIIHRPKYDDWSFPKGKVEINESLIACAHREVLEETNIQSLLCFAKLQQIQLCLSCV